MPFTFKYKKNAFFIQDPNKELKQNDYSFMLVPYFVENVLFRDKEMAEAAIAFEHELIHYLQDLMINACISDGFLTNYIEVFLARASHIEGIHFPLPFENEEDFILLLSTINSSEDVECLKTLKMLVQIYEAVFRKNYFDKNLGKYGFNVPEDEKNKYRLCFKDLLESHAYHKAYWDMFCRHRSLNKNGEILHSLALDCELYPYSFDKGFLECNDFRKTIYWRKQYMLPFYLVLKSFPQKEIQRDYVNYCIHEIPHNYYKSPAKLMHTLFLFIIETSLGIPGVEYIVKEVQGGADVKVFSPPYRFFKIIDTINESHDLIIEMLKCKDSFKEFFNYISKKNGWFSYEIATETLNDSIKHRLEFGNNEVIIHYMMNIWEKKGKAPDDFIQMIPAELIGRFSLPIIIQNELGMNITFHDDTSSLDVSYLDLYSIFFKHGNHRYKQLKKKDNKGTKFNKFADNSIGAVREIIDRLFSADSRDALTNSQVFHCPFAHEGCPNICDNCSSFKSFKDVTINCKNRIYRKQDFRELTYDARGNSPDCMYYNFMIDNNYKNININ